MATVQHAIFPFNALPVDPDSPETIVTGPLMSTIVFLVYLRTRERIRVVLPTCGKVNRDEVSCKTWRKSLRSQRDVLPRVP